MKCYYLHVKGRLKEWRKYYSDSTFSIHALRDVEVERVFGKAYLFKDPTSKGVNRLAVDSYEI